MKRGYITIHRKITDHWIWEEKPFTKGQAWIDILLECNHSGMKILFGNELVECKRGESLNSLDVWSTRWGWSKSKVRRFIELLKNDKMITQQPTQKTTHLSVINYSTYQLSRHSNETQTDTATDTQTKRKRH